MGYSSSLNREKKDYDSTETCNCGSVYRDKCQTCTDIGDHSNKQTGGNNNCGNTEIGGHGSTETGNCKISVHSSTEISNHGNTNTGQRLVIMAGESLIIVRITNI